MSEAPMLRYVVIFLILGIVAASLGFGVLAGTAAGIARLLFWVFLLGTLLSFLLNMARREG